MNQSTHKGVSLATSSKLYQVTFQDHTTWTGTKRELFAHNPDWWQYAQEVQQPLAPATHGTQEDYSGDIVTQIEQDYADADIPRLNRMPRSSLNYQTIAGQRLRAEWRPGTVIQRRAHAAPPNVAPHTDDLPETRLKRQKHTRSRHWLVYLGVGMLAMLALWVALQALVSWWNTTQDDWKYGRPRTYQFDAVFEHSDSAANPTHIIIVNLSRHIIIIELPGGDPSHSRIYSGPILFQDGGDLLPVTGKAIDVNSDGKLDLVVYVQDQRIVFINDGTQFRPAKSGEHITIPK